MRPTVHRSFALLLLALFVTLSGAEAAAPPTVAGPAFRWDAASADDGQVFEGDRFVPLPASVVVGAGPFSVSVWVYANDLKGGNSVYGRGIARSNRSEQVGDWVLSVQPDGRVRFCNWRKAGDDKAGCHVSRAAVVTTGAWHLVVATWDGKTTRLYVNGNEAAYTSVTTAIGWGIGHEVGRGWTQPDYFWDGLIDDLRVYKRALDAVQIKQMVASPPRVRSVDAGAAPAGDPKVSAAIDERLMEKLREKKIQAVPAADDAAFHRRVMLDLTGRIPTRWETEAFLADKSPDKRSKLIDAQLAGKEMPLYWSQVLSNWMMPREGRRDPVFVAYLRNGLGRNKSWDRFARETITGTAGGASSFLAYRRPALKDHSIARDVGEAFFGVNLRCAQCHDHPSVKAWTRERFYGLSAFFVRTTERPLVRGQPPGPLAFFERPSGELEYVAEKGKKKIAKPTFLDGTIVEDPPAGGETYSRREALARLALDRRSPYFKQAMANRVWRKLMGRGLVEPGDMMHGGNPPTHPELLKLLADDFAEHGYDLRRLISVIMNSQAYARSSRWTGKEAPDERLYAAAVLKPLDADQLAASLPLATGYYDALLEGKAKRVMAQLRSTAAWRVVVVQFDAQSDEFEPTATQALFLINSDYVQTNFLAKSNLAQALNVTTDDAALARRAYLSILSRPPTSDEVSRISRYLKKRGDKARAEACREVVWALLTGAEFRFNH